VDGALVTLTSNIHCVSRPS